MNQNEILKRKTNRHNVPTEFQLTEIRLFMLEMNKRFHRRRYCCREFVFAFRGPVALCAYFIQMTSNLWWNFLKSCFFFVRFVRAFSIPFNIHLLLPNTFNFILIFSVYYSFRLWFFELNFSSLVPDSFEITLRSLAVHSSTSIHFFCICKFLLSPALSARHDIHRMHWVTRIERTRSGFLYRFNSATNRLQLTRSKADVRLMVCR